MQVHISALRRTLGRDAVQTAGEGYRLGTGVSVDVAEFRRAAASGADQLARGDVAVASATLRAALDLWRGPALADLTGSAFAAAQAQRLEELRLDVIEDRVQADLVMGRHRDVIGELESLVAVHPLREGLRGMLMKALYGAGRQADALVVYDAGRRQLRDELGLDPSPALRELHHLLLTQREDVSVPRPVAAPPWHLPVLLDETIGRDPETTALTAMFLEGHARLVTVLGPGGVGKSRVALAVGDRIRKTLPEGVAFVSLAQADKDADVAVTICAALRLRTEDDPMDTLVAALPTRRMLLILDNFEHVLDAAGLLPTMLAAAPGLQILVTSRHPLDLRGEGRFMLDPLSSEATDSAPSMAAQLFLTRAATVDPDFEPGPADLVLVEDIAGSCDGLPLALELAAAHTRALPLAELRERLWSPLRLPAGGARDLPARHRTLRACIAWSTDALDGRHARLLTLWAVFRGGFTLTAAAAVGEVDADTALGCIEVLLKHSLLRRLTPVGGSPRFDMLATIREHVVQSLDPDERLAVQRRHAEHYRLWMRPGQEPGKFSADATTWLAQLAERANLRLAIRWALADAAGELAADLVVSAAAVWDHAGPRPELLAWLALVLDRDDVSPGRRCDALWWTAALVADSDASLMAAPLGSARSFAEATGDTRRLSWVHLLLAVAELYGGRPGGAARRSCRAARH